MKFIIIKSKSEILKTLNFSGYTEEGAYFSEKMFKYCGKKLISNKITNPFYRYGYQTTHSDGLVTWSWAKEWVVEVDENQDSPILFSEEDEAIIKELDQLVEMVMENESLTDMMQISCEEYRILKEEISTLKSDLSLQELLRKSLGGFVLIPHDGYVFIVSDRASRYKEQFVGFYSDTRGYLQIISKDSMYGEIISRKLRGEIPGVVKLIPKES